MRTIANILLCCAMAACSFHQSEIYGIGKTTTVRVGGDGASSNSILGDTDTDKNSTAWKTTMQAAGVLFGGYFTAVGAVNHESANAYVNANGVVFDANRNIAGYLGSKVPVGGLAPGQSVPVLNQAAPLLIPKFIKP